MEPLYALTLTESEVKRLQELLGFVLYHTSPELFSVANKIDSLIGDADIDYSNIVFNKTNEDGCVVKTYKHQRFSISVK